MTTLITGLAAMQQLKKEREERAAAANRPKANWFKFEAGKDAYTVQFLQELDPSASGFDEKNGLALIAHERVSPFNFQKRALDTMESEGRCYPDEWHKTAQATDPEYKGGWKTKVNLYISVLVERDGKKQVEILSRNFNSSFVEDLMEIALDEGTITDRKYVIKKSGAGTQTRWSIKPAKGDDAKAEVTDLEAYDLKEVAVRAVPYDEQPKFFEMEAKVGAVSAGSSGAPAGRTAPADEDVW